MKFLKIQSPCPRVAELSEVIKDGVCSHCCKTVHDLDEMTDSERQRFYVDSGREPVCVSYTLPKSGLSKRSAVAALAVSAVAASLPLAADELETSVDSTATAESADRCPVNYDEAAEYDDIIIMVGGVRDWSISEYLELDEQQIDSDEDLLPDLPVVYESGD